MIFSDLSFIINTNKLAKSSLLRHSRAGGNPERIEITGSKSALISSLRGNDEMAKYLGFYETINTDELVKKLHFLMANAHEMNFTTMTPLRCYESNVTEIQGAA